MWIRWRNRTDNSVTCIACDSTVNRRRAREYDKFGDRWDREGKQFEYLCKKCDQDLCHQPRADLENILVTIEEDATSVSEFISNYYSIISEVSDTIEETER